jgi:phosphoglycolate phosphatase-like HAD superfamily hydrolase
MAGPEDVRRVTRETADRLAALGIHLDGTETTAELAAVQEAVERFEDAVQARGGDLMLDEGVPGKPVQPDDPHFGLPRRRPFEPVADYLERLARATAAVIQHPSLDSQSG